MKLLNMSDATVQTRIPVAWKTNSELASPMFKMRLTVIVEEIRVLKLNMNVLLNRDQRMCSQKSCSKRKLGK